MQTPDTDVKEITAKGSIDERAVLERRADLVERLHGDAAEVILIP